jgi:hypothetical protein
MERITARDAVWQAFSAEKQEWKNSGNYYTPEELAKMEEAAVRELRIVEVAEPITRAD